MTVIDEIRAERERQISQEGWTREHDDEHSNGELALAGAYYAIDSVAQALPNPNIDKPSRKWTLHHLADAVWPFEPLGRKPKAPRRNLIRSAALLVAEIERLDRTALKQGDQP